MEDSKQSMSLIRARLIYFSRALLVFPPGRRSFLVPSPLPSRCWSRFSFCFSHFRPCLSTVCTSLTHLVILPAPSLAFSLPPSLLSFPFSLSSSPFWFLFRCASRCPSLVSTFGAHCGSVPSSAPSLGRGYAIVTVTITITRGSIPSYHPRCVNRGLRCTPLAAADTFFVALDRTEAKLSVICAQVLGREVPRLTLGKIDT